MMRFRANGKLLLTGEYLVPLIEYVSIIEETMINTVGALI